MPLIHTRRSTMGHNLILNLLEISIVIVSNESNMIHAQNKCHSTKATDLHILFLASHTLLFSVIRMRRIIENNGHECIGGENNWQVVVRDHIFWHLRAYSKEIKFKKAK